MEGYDPHTLDVGSTALPPGHSLASGACEGGGSGGPESRRPDLDTLRAQATFAPSPLLSQLEAFLPRMKAANEALGEVDPGDSIVDIVPKADTDTEEKDEEGADGLGVEMHLGIADLDDLPAGVVDGEENDDESMDPVRRALSEREKPTRRGLIQEVADAPAIAPVADAIAAQLSRGVEPSSFGITVSLGLSPPEPWLTEYKAFAEELSERLDATLDDEDRGCVYIYPPNCLHITVVTLISFFNEVAEAASEAGQGAAKVAWHGALTDALESPTAAVEPTTPITLRIRRPTLGNKAAIFRIEDRDGAVASLRTSVNELFRAPHPAFGAHGWLLDDKIGFNIPNIVHSSFMRFVRVPKDPDAVARAFEAVAARWTDLDVEFTAAQVGVEAVPYLHLNAEDVSSHERIVALRPTARGWVHEADD